MHKSEIEYQTKFCDETFLNARLDELESLDTCDGYVQLEKKLIKRLIEMCVFEPRCPYASHASSSELRGKSVLNAELNKTLWKYMLEKRVVYRCAESDYKELKFFVDNFDSIFNFASQDVNGNLFLMIIKNIFC